MILYVNGDSHSAGAEAVNTHAFAEDDPTYTQLGRAPHPDNLAVSYGKKLADSFNFDFVCHAESGSSNSRILRTTREYLKNNKPNLVVIGWATWEREEFLIDGVHWQFSSNMDIDGPFPPIPNNVKQAYRKWVSHANPNKSEEYWHRTIYEFHSELTNLKIPHLFFNTLHYFHSDRIIKLDWNNTYISPYDYKETFWQWLNNQGFQSTKGYHYSADAHTAWAKYLLTYIQNESIMFA